MFVPAKCLTCFSLYRKGLILKSAKLFVGNLSPETTGAEIRDLFGDSGEVESCHLLTDPETGDSEGFAFIEMKSPAEASQAREKLDGHDLRGKTLRVQETKPMGGAW